MKKLILILLAVISFVNFGGSALASSKKPDKNKLYNMFGGAFCYLLDNRNNENEDILQKKQKAMSLLTAGCKHDRELVLESYNNREAECIECLTISKNEKNQNKIKIAQERLAEIHNIARIIGLKRF